eukprot:CAMPEP_0197054496 /NCGR_PEP_ID=MMETSP1384-20130603/42851_1 /TAXON_ID=29189 /ORGANISM="Ammonia sp." /LENGTH=57 /DNA_ID=CAMNT_0042487707 /DNA_START=18 /DNA_END=191 /DNA_ORIENTATION=+
MHIAHHAGAYSAYLTASNSCANDSCTDSAYLAVSNSCTDDSCTDSSMWCIWIIVQQS